MSSDPSGMVASSDQPALAEALWRVATRAEAWRASMAVVAGALLAWPWQLEAPAAIVGVALWLALVPTVGLLAPDVVGDPLEGMAPGLRGADRLLFLGLAALLVGLVRPLAAAGLVVAWVALAVLARRGVPTSIRGALAELAVPALLTWFVLGGDAALDAGAMTSTGGVAALASWLAFNAIAPVCVLAWSAVLASARADAEALGWRGVAWAVTGWAAAVVALATAGVVGAVLGAIAVGLALWSVWGAASVVGARRRAELAVLGLVVTAGCLAFLP